jgi:hypothetical protein
MNTAYFKTNKIPLLVMGVSSVLFSRGMLFLFNDPEGSNMLVSLAAAVIVYLLSLAVYLLTAPATNLNRFLLVILVPLAVSAVFYVILG